MSEGIKSVDFKIEASGEGIVNWNGTAGGLRRKDDKDGTYSDVGNHLLPKMRGIDPLRLKHLSDQSLENARIFVSQNCVRSYIFKDEGYNLSSVTVDNVEDVLASFLGLMRGYLIPSASVKRKSPLLLEDFISTTTGVRNENFVNAKEKMPYSKTMHVTDELKYVSYGSIVIEDLQFIPVVSDFDRNAYKPSASVEEATNLANKITAYLKLLATGTNLNPEAVFENNYVRVGGITNDGEAGILLNDDAIDLLVSETLKRFKEVFVFQAKGNLKVDNIIVDYNDGLPMRVKNPEKLSQLNTEKDDLKYRVYFENKELPKGKKEKDTKGKK